MIKLRQERACVVFSFLSFRFGKKSRIPGSANGDGPTVANMTSWAHQIARGSTFNGAGAGRFQSGRLLWSKEKS